MRDRLLMGLAIVAVAFAANAQLAKQPQRIQVGTITLSGGSGTATVNSGAICVCSNTSAATVCKPSVSGSTLTTASGAGSDVVSYHCI